MKFFEFLVHAFVNTFGITQPTPEGAARAARYLAVVAVVAMLAAVAAGFGLHAALRR